MLRIESNRLLYTFDSETLSIEAWGESAVRVRATHEAEFDANVWALSETPARVDARIAVENNQGTLVNGKIRAVVRSEESFVCARAKISIYNSDGKLLLEEYDRQQVDPKWSALSIKARDFKPRLGGDYHVTARFESVDPNERIYGMGHYQHPYLNLKGTDLELAHRNSQASVPFALSSARYGFLWNNPSIGRAVFGKNMTTFEAYSSKVLDYWIVAGDNPAEIVEAYARATGTVPMMPEYGLGFWQCKLRYQTQEELLEVAREYQRRKLPIDLIVVDYFHWPRQGDWKFDPVYWPEPDAMVAELKSLNIELMVSVWPTVDRDSENFDEMLRKGLLAQQDRGIRISMTGSGMPIFFDATNPASRTYVWSKILQNYYSKGIKVFWLDEAEPEYSVYDHDIYRYYLGTSLSIGNIFPREFARTFYEGMQSQGQENIVNLARCAWAGSQKYGVLIWSGDIESTWESFKIQLYAGLSMGIAGMPWSTTDIGGFRGGDPNDPSFRELFVRWLQMATYCPVMRFHGDREPKQPQHGTTGGAFTLSGAPNEVWSYGEEVYAICEKYLKIREELRDYTRMLMREAHERGAPVMRPCFYDFPDDSKCWEVDDQYMYGPKYLCAPILQPGQRKRDVHLPAGTKWKDSDGNVYEGGRTILVDCPLESMPVFTKL